MNSAEQALADANEAVLDTHAALRLVFSAHARAIDALARCAAARPPDPSFLREIDSLRAQLARNRSLFDLPPAPK